MKYRNGYSDDIGKAEDKKNMEPGSGTSLSVLKNSSTKAERLRKSEISYKQQEPQSRQTSNSYKECQHCLALSYQHYNQDILHSTQNTHLSSTMAFSFRRSPCSGK